MLRYPPYTPGKLRLARTMIMGSVPKFSFALKDLLIVALTVAVGVLSAKVVGRL
jgi:hypothetical protein